MKKTTLEMNEELANAYSKIGISLYYYHYKGGFYVTKDFAFLDGELLVLYSRFAGPNFDLDQEFDIKYARLASAWFDIVDGGATRFTKINQKSYWTTPDGSIIND